MKNLSMFRTGILNINLYSIYILGCLSGHAVQHISYYPCGVHVVGIGSYVRSGIGEVVDLLAAVHYISRCVAIWDPPKSVKRPFNVTRTLYS